MADKSFGVKELNLLNASGTPTITSPNNLNLNANNVAISTNVTIGGNLTVSGNIGISSLNVTGISTFTDIQVAENDVVRTLDYEFSVLETPGHTLDHIANVEKSKQLVFCGDTLFSAGCVRVFEGTFEQMHDSIQKLNQLD